MGICVSEPQRAGMLNEIAYLVLEDSSERLLSAFTVQDNSIKCSNKAELRIVLWKLTCYYKGSPLKKVYHNIHWARPRTQLAVWLDILVGRGFVLNNRDIL